MMDMALRGYSCYIYYRQTRGADRAGGRECGYGVRISWPGDPVRSGDAQHLNGQWPGPDRIRLCNTPDRHQKGRSKGTLFEA